MVTVNAASAYETGCVSKMRDRPAYHNHLHRPSICAGGPGTVLDDDRIAAWCFFSASSTRRRAVAALLRARYRFQTYLPCRTLSASHTALSGTVQSAFLCIDCTDRRWVVSKSILPLCLSPDLIERTGLLLQTPHAFSCTVFPSITRIFLQTHHLQASAVLLPHCILTTNPHRVCLAPSHRGLTAQPTFAIARVRALLHPPSRWS